MPLPDKDAKKLPTKDEPLRLADGTVILPGGRVQERSPDHRFVEVPTNSEAQRIVVNARRKVSDLPDVPRTMNAIGVVLTYTLYGLTDLEIATQTGMSEDQIGRLKMNESYTTMHDTVVRSILDAETDAVRTIFQQNARNAALEMVDAMRNGTRVDRMSAAKDLLDRAGHRPADVIEHKHRMEAGLTIEIVRKDRSDLIPTIDMDAEETN